jgi:hypothetical protein
MMHIPSETYPLKPEIGSFPSSLHSTLSEQVIEATSGIENARKSSNVDQIDLFCDCLCGISGLDITFRTGLPLPENAGSVPNPYPVGASVNGAKTAA